MTGTICTLQTPRAVALSVRLDAVDLDACSIVAFAQAMLDEGTIDGRPMTERERRLLLEASMEDIFDALEQHAAGLEEQHARQQAQSAAMAGFVEAMRPYLAGAPERPLSEALAAMPVEEREVAIELGIAAGALG